MAHTPHDEEHRIAAGHLTLEAGRAAQQDSFAVVDLPPGELELVGIQPRDKKHFDKALNAWIGKGKLDPKQRYCVIRLPLALNVYSARRVEVKRPPQHPFADVDGEHMQPDTVSMVQVFEYLISGRPDIQPPGGVPSDTSGERLKLHVFAEPMHPPKPFHGRNAYTRMAQMFGLRIVPITPLWRTPHNSNVPGLTHKDTEGLSDTIARGESGSNCDALIIDRTTLGSESENEA